MTAQIRNLSVLCYAQGFTLWHYKAGAYGLNDISGAGFFDKFKDMVNSGDMILVSAIDGGGIYFVTIIDGSVSLNKI